MKDSNDFPKAWEKAFLAFIGVVNLAMFGSLLYGIVRERVFA